MKHTYTDGEAGAYAYVLDVGIADVSQLVWLMHGENAEVSARMHSASSIWMIPPTPQEVADDDDRLHGLTLTQGLTVAVANAA